MTEGKGKGGSEGASGGETRRARGEEAEGTEEREGEEEGTVEGGREGGHGSKGAAKEGKGTESERGRERVGVRGLHRSPGDNEALARGTTRSNVSHTIKSLAQQMISLRKKKCDSTLFKNNNS